MSGDILNIGAEVETPSVEAPQQEAPEMGQSIASEDVPVVEHGEQPQEQGPWYAGKFTGIPEDKQRSLNLDRHSDEESFADSIISMRKKLNEKGVMRPGEDATEQEWDAYWEHATGRPKLPTDYEVKLPENLHEWGITKDDMTPALERMHKNGFGPEMAQTAIDLHFESLANMEEAKQEQQTKWADETRKHMEARWGEDYDVERAELEHFVKSEIAVFEKKTGMSDIALDLKESGIINHPLFIEWVNQIRELKGTEANAPTAETMSSLEAAYADAKARRARHKKGTTEWADANRDCSRILQRIHGPM